MGKDAKIDAPKDMALTTFTPVVSFSGYPDGETRVEFWAGVESPPVTAEYKRLIIEKGLATD